MEARSLFFEDLASALDWWTGFGIKVLADPEANADSVLHPEGVRSLAERLAQAGIKPEEMGPLLKDLLYGLSHSVLTIIDGGTEMAETVRLRLTTPDGVSVGEGLHELFLGFLIDSGRQP